MGDPVHGGSSGDPVGDGGGTSTPNSPVFTPIIPAVVQITIERALLECQINLAIPGRNYHHVCRTKQPCYNLDLTFQPCFMAVATRFCLKSYPQAIYMLETSR